jgi:hypothetical protein
MSDINGKATEDWKNRLDALRFISETHREARSQRRTTQLQVFLTTTSFYALIGAGKFTGKMQMPQTHRTYFIVGAWLLVVGVAAISSVYFLGMNAQNRVNRKLAENAEGQIMRMVNLPDPVGGGRLIAKTYFWEIAMIVIFATAVGISVTLF